MLISPCSNGSTVRECVAAMARDYSEKPIVIDSHTNDRREIQCPRFTVKP